MSKNLIQFQAGLSLLDFQKRYGTEAKCRRVLYQLKWPHGFRCPRCCSRKKVYIKTYQRYQCCACHHQTTVTVGTLLEHTKLAVQQWFYAIYLLTQSKNSISALSLKRSIGVSYGTAWGVKQKIIKTMELSENKVVLSGDIQVDDAYIGGKKRGGKRGRGAGKQPFIAAISIHNNKPFQAKFSVVDSFKKIDVSAWAAKHVQPGSHVMSDGMPGFRAMQNSHVRHTAIKSTGNAHVQDVIFRWVNTILGNVKRAIDGTYHAIRKPYIHRYLTLFQFRFNHRFHLPQMMTKVVELLVSTGPIRVNQCLA